MNTLTKVISIINVLCTLTCASPEFIPKDHVIVVRSSDPNVQMAARNGTIQWDACNKAQLVTSTDTEFKDAITLDILPPGQKLYTVEGQPASGLTFYDEDYNPIRIQVISFTEPYFYTPIIAHEFGHVLTGREHQSHGLMMAMPLDADSLDVGPFECSLIREHN